MSATLNDLQALIKLTKEYTEHSLHNTKWVTVGAQDYLFYQSLCQGLNQSPPAARPTGRPPGGSPERQLERPSLNTTKEAPAQLQPTATQTTFSLTKTPLLKAALAKQHSRPPKTLTPPENLSKPEAPSHKEKHAHFILQKVTPTISDSLDDIKKVLLETSPLLTLHDEVPDVTSPEVLVLSFNEQLPLLTFLEKVTAAISDQLASARLHHSKEPFNTSPRLKLIIAEERSLRAHPKLSDQIYHNSEEEGNWDGSLTFLGKTPLLLLENLERYIEEPKLKALLWKTLRGRLSPKK